MPIKNVFLLFLLSLLPILSFGQELKERRVYYLDCSFSMVSKKLWEPVCADLINAIKSIKDEKTELMIIPFAKDNSSFNLNKLQPITANADEAGKTQLVNAINALGEPQKKTMTYLRDPLCDFYAHRVAPSKVTYMFLMTDGQDEEKPESLFLNELRHWGSLYGDKNVYGFYVMLDNAAKNSNVEDIIDSQPHLWKVVSANVNINLVRLHNQGVFNARNERYFELPYYGNLNGKKITAQFDSKAPCQIKKVEKDGNKIRFYVNNKTDVYQMPSTSSHNLHISITNGGQFDFLVTENVRIEILSKPERSLKINMR